MPELRAEGTEARNYLDELVERSRRGNTHDARRTQGCV